MGKLGTIASVALLVVGAARPAAAQRGQPKTSFSLADFSRLRWLEGSWRGTSPNAETIYETCHFTTDSTVEIAYRTDSSSGRETLAGRVYLSAGRIFHTMGSGRWTATRVDSSGVFFIPQGVAHNTFTWSRTSPDAWTSTMRTALGGRERDVEYAMQRTSR